MINHDKCIFGKITLNFLGHTVSKNGITLPADRINLILWIEEFCQHFSKEEECSFSATKTAKVTPVGKYPSQQMVMCKMLERRKGHTQCSVTINFTSWNLLSATCMAT